LIEIECVPGGAVPMPRHVFRRLWRCGASDGSRSTEHIWRDWGWEFGLHRSWYMLGGDDPPGGWSYLFEFTDESLGTCQVNRVNAALAALGWQVDRRGDADRD
jgi:hypothetical protein